MLTVILSNCYSTDDILEDKPPVSIKNTTHDFFQKKQTPLMLLYYHQIQTGTMNELQRHVKYIFHFTVLSTMLMWLQSRASQKDLLDQ